MPEAPANQLVSIVMPSMDSGQHIAAAIESVLSQNGPPLELLIQDGGSRDQTLSVVHSFADERISLLSEPDRGQADALNRAVARASGPWILWLNADDLLAPGALDAVGPLLDGPHDLIYGDFSAVGPDGALLKRYRSSDLRFWRLLAMGCYVFSGSILVRRETVARYGGFDPSLHFAMDYDFLLKVANGARAVHAHREIAQFRIHPGAKTSRHKWQPLQEALAVRRRYAGRSPLMLICLAFGEARALAYQLLRPVWQSRAWRWVRPSKRL